MANIIPRSHIDRAFQLAATLNVRNTAQGAVWYNARIIYDWIKHAKFPYFPLPKNIPAEFVRNESGNSVDIFYHDKNLFCCEIKHPDKSNPQRIWKVEAEIIAAGEKVLFGVKVTYSTPEGVDYRRDIFSVPDFVRKIAKENHFCDVRELGGKILTASSEETLQELFALVSDPKRIFPVVVVTDSFDSPLVEPETLAEKIGLIAHVAHIPAEQTFRWKELTGDYWDVYNGAVRTYYKQVDFTDDNDLFRHPLFTAEKISSFEHTNSDGEELFGAKAFTEFLIEKIQNNDTRMRLDWKSLGHKFLFAARQEATLKKLASTKKLIQSEAERDWTALYSGELDSQAEKIRELENENAACYDEIERLQNALDDAENDAKSREHYFRHRIAELQRQLAEAGKLVDIIPAECKYEDIPQWADKYFHGKIFLANDVQKDLPDMTYKDPRKFYEALQLLGTEYWQMKTAAVPNARVAYEEKRAELYLKDNFAITREAAGMQGDEYKFKDLSGNNIPVRDIRHLTHSNSRESRFCLRIYFSWDATAETVLVHHMTDHLDTRNS